MLELKDTIAQYTTLGKPIPYKSIKLYPFTINDYFEFYSCEDVLRYEKNEIPDIEVIQMNYLTFVALRLFQDTKEINGFLMGELWKQKFFLILHKATGFPIEDISLRWDDNKVVLFFGDIKISAKEFDDIRKIILFQNIYDYDDRSMSKDFKRVVTEYYEVKNKGYKNLTLNDKIDVIMSKTSRSQTDINGLTLLRFESIFRKLVENEDYQLNKIAEGNGCTFKKPIEHWVYKKEKSKYADVFSSTESLTS